MNSACHNDSHACFFAGLLAGDLAGDWGSKWRCNDLMDFDGDLERCRALLGDPERESGLAVESVRTWEMMSDRVTARKADLCAPARSAAGQEQSL